MSIQYSIVGIDGENFITVFVPGEDAPLVARNDHPNFDQIVEQAVSGDAEGLPELFDVSLTAAAHFDKLSERVTVSHGRVYFDGDEVVSSLTQQIARFVSENVEDWRPLVAFFEKVQSNPNEHSREQLYDWLDAHQFTITESGDVVGYKGVQSIDGEYRSISTGRAIVDGQEVSGTIPNAIGSTIEMPRSAVAHDPSQSCSTGLHVATRAYAQSWSRNGVTLEVHVNPRDVVSVPTDAGGEKVRVCRYTVAAINEAEFDSALRLFEFDEDEREDDLRW